MKFLAKVEPRPCSLSPCGPNSQCMERNGQAVCTCLREFVGSPPNCRPECTINSECATRLACINQKCQDPCLNRCGQGATCRVQNHSPICSCPVRTTGDAFTRCFPEIEPSKLALNTKGKKITTTRNNNFFIHLKKQ